MKKIIRLRISIALFAFTCCSSPEEKKNRPAETSETASDTMVAKESFELNSIGESREDTLSLVTCAGYVYSPFGQLVSASDISRSLLKNFKVDYRVDTIDKEPQTFQLLKFKSSRLILFFDNDSEATTHSYIFKGEVKDEEVTMSNDVKIGVSKNEFLSRFFNQVPSDWIEKKKVIIFKSCVEDIKHTYVFRNNKLESVTFVTDTYWKLDY